jgi:putative zinc finger protein
MPHLDEGTLHALLDGELEGTEVMEIQAHLGGCASCGSRFKDIREFMAEADRLLGSVDLPSSPSRAAPAPPTPSVTAAEAPRPAREAPARALTPRRPLPTPAAPPRPSAWEEPPVLLIPDNPDSIEIRQRWLHGMGWAATVAVAVGLGFMVSQLRSGTPAPGAAAAGAERPEQPTNAVVSSEETPRPDSALDRTVTVRRDSAKPPAAPRAPAVAKTATPKPSKPAEEKQALAAKDEASEAPKEEITPTAGPESSSDSEPANADTDTVATGREDPAVIRARAAEALAELDRERIRSRAAAATAALDAQGRLRAARTVEQAPAPPPPTLEQRSRIYLRIGLDEAARQLGGPVHVIEGLNASFMGLAQGGLSRGADTTRPVVRVVYQDSQGRMILLDQQRLRPGQTAPTRSSTPTWVTGDVLLHLQGEVGPEILRNIQPRVR